MIFLSGHKANGKNTITDLLDKSGYLTFDTGPFIRNLREQYHLSSISTGEFVNYMKRRTGNSRWDDDLVAEACLKEYPKNKNKKDIVISGYRSMEGIQYLSSKLNGSIFPDQGIHIWFVECSPEVALQRFNLREGRIASLDDYLEICSQEDSRGLIEIREHADFFINNSFSEESLRQQIEGYLGSYTSSKNKEHE